MKGAPRTIAALVGAMLAIAAVAHAAEEPTREGYVAKVEPICKRNTVVSQRILKGARTRIKNHDFAPAGRQFIRVSVAFAKGIEQIVAVPRPPADDARLQKWVKFLRIVRTRLRNLGQELKAGERLEATHESIQIERSSNAANNVGFAFGFHYCRLTRSRFK
jgi:hypothetical protein